MSSPFTDAANAVRLAVRAIARSKTRSILTVLGILIGVSAVTTVVALADGASSKVGGEIDGFGANALFVHPQPTQSSGARGKVTGRLTEADARAIAHEAVSVAGAGVWLSTAVQVVYQDQNVATLAAGVNLDYFPIRKFKLSEGSLWSETDETLKTKVVVLGETVRQKLFGDRDPIGQVIRVGNSPHRVIGVLAARGTTTFGDDQDDRIMMPVGSFRARIMHTSPGRVDQILASATADTTVERARRQITEILRQRHHIRENADNDFAVNTQAEFRKTQERIFSILSALLAGVATISLLVGGIGVMNIMLVSVAERTREIGIRMSIGAREGDILMQFLTEAVVLSLIGGILGMGLGVGATFALAHGLGWAMTPSPLSLLVATGTSAAIGLVFGYLPARRAARLDPIEALRVE